MANPWKIYQDLKFRNLYKNKYLKGRGLTASQIAETMRKFKVYVDRINTTPIIGKKVREAENTTQLISILDSVFNNEWKNHIKDNYKDMPHYFRDYAKFVELMVSVVDMFRSEAEFRDLYWPDGSLVTIDDFSKSMKAKHNRINLTIGVESEIYQGGNALIKVCQYVGFEGVSRMNLTANGLKLLVKHVPLGKETKYMEAGEGWFLCTCCDTKVKLRLIKIITGHFHADIKAELV